MNGLTETSRRKRVQVWCPCLLTGLALACLCAPIQGQATQSKKSPPEPAKTKATVEKSHPRKTDVPIDDTQKAADALRILLGLKPHTPQPEDKKATLFRPVTHDTDPQATDESRQHKNGPHKNGPQGKEPSKKTSPEKKQDPKNKPVDETQSAAAALKLLMPNAKPVETPPDLNLDAPIRPVPQDPVRRDKPMDEMELIAQQLRRVASPAPSHFTPLVQGDTIPVHGSATIYYRNRRTSDISDADLRGLLALEIGDPDRHPVTGNFLIRGFADLDAGSSSSFFDDLDDTLDRNFNIYEASIDLHRVGSFSVLRLGRQTIDETPALAWFDGIRADTEELTDWGLWFGGYAGVPTHLYESSSSGDFIGGIATGARPWHRGRVRIDWMHVEDRWNQVDYQNDLIGVSLWQGIGDHSQLYARQTWLDGDGREFQLRGSTFVPEWDLTAQASYRELLTTQRASTTEFDPFSDMAFDYRPYRQFGTTLSKAFGEHLHVDGGLDVRRLKNRGGEGQFNREFERYFVSTTFQDAADSTLALTILGESWNSDGEDIATYSGDLTARFSQDWTTSLGSAYYMYKYDTFAQREHDHVRVYSARVDYHYHQNLRINGRYEYEKSDLDEVQTFRIGMTWTF